MLYLGVSYNRTAKTIFIKRKRRHILYNLNSTLALTGLDDENNNRGEIQPNPWKKQETDVQVYGLDKGQYKDIYSPVALKCTHEFFLDDSDISNLAEKDRAKVAMQNTIVKLMGHYSCQENRQRRPEHRYIPWKLMGGWGGGGVGGVRPRNAQWENASAYMMCTKDSRGHNKPGCGNGS